MDSLAEPIHVSKQYICELCGYQISTRMICKVIHTKYYKQLRVVDLKFFDWFWQNCPKHKYQMVFWSLMTISQQLVESNFWSLCKILNFEYFLFSTGRHGRKNQNKYSKFDTSNLMSYRVSHGKLFWELWEIEICKLDFLEGSFLSWVWEILALQPVFMKCILCVIYSPICKYL